MHFPSQRMLLLLTSSPVPYYFRAEAKLENLSPQLSLSSHSVQTLVRDIYANPESEGPCAKTLAEPLSMPMRPSTRSLTGAST